MNSKSHLPEQVKAMERRMKNMSPKEMKSKEHKEEMKEYKK